VSEVNVVEVSLLGGRSLPACPDGAARANVQFETQTRTIPCHTMTHFLKSPIGYN
jgi:hypothetical protein